MPAAPTRERVLAAARELDYRPSGIARALKRRETRTLGLLVTDLGNPFYPQVVRAVEAAAHERGYDPWCAVVQHDCTRARPHKRALTRAPHWHAGCAVRPNGAHCPLIAFIGRQIGNIVQMAFGGATIMLFGRVPQSKQLLLAVVALGSIAWVAALAVVLPIGVGMLPPAAPDRARHAASHARTRARATDVTARVECSSESRGPSAR